MFDISLQLRRYCHAITAEAEHHRYEHRVDNAEVAAQELLGAAGLAQVVPDGEDPLDLFLGIGGQRLGGIASVQAEGHLRAQVDETRVHLGRSGAGLSLDQWVLGPQVGRRIGPGNVLADGQTVVDHHLVQQQRRHLARGRMAQDLLTGIVLFQLDLNGLEGNVCRYKNQPCTQ